MGRTWSSMEDFEAFLDDGGMVEVDDDMPDEYRTAVFRFIELHANSELMGGLTERDWIPMTPGLRHKMAVLAKTQDEIGHGHLLYMVAADLGVKTRREMLEDLFAGRSRFHNVFHYPARTWGDQVAICLLVDGAAVPSQKAVYKDCSYGPYKRILKRIIAEEGFHLRLGEERVLRIAEGTDAQRAMFQQSIDDWWWPALRLFGPGLQARRQAGPLAPQVREERGDEGRLGPEVRSDAAQLRLRHPRPRPDPRRRDRYLDLRSDRLGTPQEDDGDGRPRYGTTDCRGFRSVGEHQVGPRRLDAAPAGAVA